MTTLLLILLAALPAPGKDTLGRPACVLDEARALTPTEWQALEDRCVAIDQSGAAQLAVLVTDDFRDHDRDDFANQVFHSWGIGHKGKDDGVLVLLSPGQRKWRIEVGYGLESRLTDARAAEIGKARGTPEWKQAHWAAGLLAVVDALTPIIERPDVAASPAQAKGAESEMPLWQIAFLILVVGLGVGALLFVLIWLDGAESRRRKRRVPSAPLPTPTRADDELASRRQVISNLRPLGDPVTRVYSEPRRVLDARDVGPEIVPVPIPICEPPARRDPDPEPEHHHHSSSSDDSSSSSSSSWDSGGFSGGGGDSGGGGAGGDF